MGKQAGGRRRRRVETLARRSRKWKHCRRCGEPMRCSDPASLCAACRDPSNALHAHWVDQRMAGRLREVDWSDAPIWHAYAGWQRRTFDLAAFMRRRKRRTSRRPARRPRR